MKNNIEEFFIYIFRHGQTTYNRDRIFTGWKNPKLTNEGIKNAKEISKKLRNKKLGIAIHTSLIRSKRTLYEVLKYHPECKKILENNNIIERSYGDLSGISHDNFIKKNGIKEFNKIHRGWNVSAKNGESFKDVEKRVKIFIKEIIDILKQNKTNIVISGHGNSIRLFRKIIEKSSIKEAISWNIPYDKVYIYKVLINKNKIIIKKNGCE